MNILLVIIIMLAINFWQIPKILKRKQKKELIAFIGISTMATVYASLVALDIEIISPIKTITDFISGLNIDL